jgi:hypothetical protein
VHKTKKKTSEEEQKGLVLLGCSCCKALTLNMLIGWGRQPTSQQPGRGCIGAGMRIPMKLKWGYMWSYRWLKVIDKEVLAPR